MNRGLSFTPWPFKDANFSIQAPEDKEILQEHPWQERETLQVTLNRGEWCYERAIFISKFEMAAKDVGTSVCKKYFNGTGFTQTRNEKTSNIIREPTKLEHELDPTIPRKAIYIGYVEQGPTGSFPKIG